MTTSEGNDYDNLSIKRAKEILDSYNIDYSQILENKPDVEEVTVDDVTELKEVIADNTEIPDIDSPSVKAEPQETVYTESAVVAEFRNRTDEKFHLIDGRTAFDIESEIDQRLQETLDENEIAGEIVGIVLYGSRSRGLESGEQSDIDVVVEINGSELKEDALFNIFADLNLEIDGIPVDVNPIRPEETGTLEDYLPKAETYLEQKQEDESEKIFASDDDNDEQVGLKVPVDSLTVNITYTENPILNRLVENYKSSNNTISFAGMNTLLKYLDEKQHLERSNQNLSVGWYDKTDFEIKAVIDGEEFTYSGRFDIGDGKGTGGGSLIDHISDYADYTLSPNNPYHLSAEELAEKQKIKDILIPFLRKNEQLTQSDEDLIGAVKRTDPIRTTEKQYNNLIGKTVTYDSREYVVEGIDLEKDKAKIRDDNTGWYPLFQDVNLQDIVSQNIDLIETPKQENTPQATEQQENTQSTTPEITENYHITDLSLGQRKPLEKFNDNLAAIRTLKQLESEDRTATPEEQETLSKYTGWEGRTTYGTADKTAYELIEDALNLKATTVKVKEIVDGKERYRADPTRT
ncbi:MAG: nucleotidyltransferase domain-containing protein, partial [Clostridia bacterium]|nr:nucleotidyltransferase domain-containing protein [Clostridia bacterium]